MATEVTRSTETPVKTEVNATSSAPAVESVTRQPWDVASLTAHFTRHGFPPPHRFALLFPRLTASAQAALTESIRLKGVHDEITVFDGQTADGISRCLSAIELGLRAEQVPKDEFEGDEAALLQLVIDKNLSRRHLNESQRAMVGARMATMRQGARTDLAQICAMSQQQAACRMNVSRRLVQDAVKVIKDGVPALQAAVDDGILTVTAAVTVLSRRRTSSARWWIGRLRSASLTRRLRKPSALRKTTRVTVRLSPRPDATTYGAGDTLFYWQIPLGTAQSLKEEEAPILDCPSKKCAPSGWMTVGSFATSWPTIQSCSSGV